MELYRTEQLQTVDAPSENELVERAINGDDAAFASLYDQHVSHVYRHVYYHVFSPVEAEDITQETFIRAWKAISRFRPTGAPFVAWLLTIAHNLVMDHYKDVKKATTIQEAAREELRVSAAHRQEDYRSGHLREALLALGEDKQKVILMRFIDGFSYKEIAETLHKSEGAVRVMQFRALDDMKRFMGRSAPDESWTRSGSADDSLVSSR